MALQGQLMLRIDRATELRNVENLLAKMDPFVKVTATGGQIETTSEAHNGHRDPRWDNDAPLVFEIGDKGGMGGENSGERQLWIEVFSKKSRSDALIGVTSLKLEQYLQAASSENEPAVDAWLPLKTPARNSAGELHVRLWFVVTKAAPATGQGHLVLATGPLLGRPPRHPTNSAPVAYIAQPPGPAGPMMVPPGGVPMNPVGGGMVGAGMGIAAPPSVPNPLFGPPGPVVSVRPPPELQAPQPRPVVPVTFGQAPPQAPLVSSSPGLASPSGSYHGKQPTYGSPVSPYAPQSSDSLGSGHSGSQNLRPQHSPRPHHQQMPPASPGGGAYPPSPSHGNQQIGANQRPSQQPSPTPSSPMAHAAAGVLPPGSPHRIHHNNAQYPASSAPGGSPSYPPQGSMPSDAKPPGPLPTSPAAMNDMTASMASMKLEDGQRPQLHHSPSLGHSGGPRPTPPPPPTGQHAHGAAYPPQGAPSQGPQGMPRPQQQQQQQQQQKQQQHGAPPHSPHGPQGSVYPPQDRPQGSAYPPQGPQHGSVYPPQGPPQGSVYPPQGLQQGSSYPPQQGSAYPPQGQNQSQPPPMPPRQEQGQAAYPPTHGSQHTQPAAPASSPGTATKPAQKPANSGYPGAMSGQYPGAMSGQYQSTPPKNSGANAPQLPPRLPSQGSNSSLTGPVAPGGGPPNGAYPPPMPSSYGGTNPHAYPPPAQPSQGHAPYPPSPGHQHHQPMPYPPPGPMGPPGAYPPPQFAPGSQMPGPPHAQGPYPPQPPYQAAYPPAYPPAQR